MRLRLLDSEAEALDRIDVSAPFWTLDCSSFFLDYDGLHLQVAGRAGFLLLLDGLGRVRDRVSLSEFAQELVILLDVILLLVVRVRLDLRRKLLSSVRDRQSIRARCRRFQGTGPVEAGVPNVDGHGDGLLLVEVWLVAACLCDAFAPAVGRHVLHGAHGVFGRTCH